MLKSERIGGFHMTQDKVLSEEVRVRMGKALLAGYSYNHITKNSRSHLGVWLNYTRVRQLVEGDFLEVLEKHLEPEECSTVAKIVETKRQETIELREQQARAERRRGGCVDGEPDYVPPPHWPEIKPYARLYPRPTPKE
jgi:hypothetical protein